MNLLDDCPECGKQLSKNRNRCNCGWKISEIKHIERFNDRCLHQNNEVQCCEPGRFSLRGENGKWYCYDHWYELLNKKY